MKSKSRSRAGIDPDALTPAERAINQAAWRADVLKGTIAYYQTLREFGIPELLSAVEKAPSIAEPPPGASARAWEIAKNKGLRPAKVFAFPELLRESPRLIGYYRRLVGASTKAIRNVIGDPQKYETGARADLSPELAQAYADLFNTAISQLLEIESSFSESDIPALLGATSGSQIQGSIVSGKGQRAQEMVWQWILEYLAAGDFIEQLVPRSGSLASLNLSKRQDVGGVSHRVRSCSLKNRLILTYGSEPDIAIRETSGLLLTVHEVKAGIDFAGAKQRYPAAKSSFEAARSQNPACHTVFLAGCLSAAVKKLIRTEGWVNRCYLLPELEMDSKRRGGYLDQEIRPYAVR